MTKINYLFHFSDGEFDLVETRRLDLPADSPKSALYKWLGYSRRSKKVVEFDFRSMEKSQKGESRYFLEGQLTFDQEKGVLSLLGRTFDLVRRNPAEVPELVSLAVTAYLSEDLESGENYRFRSLKPSDVSFFKKWAFDQDVIRYSLTEFHRFSSEADVIDWFYGTLFDSKTFQLGIVEQGSGQLLGYAGVSGINEIDQNAEYFILLGEKDFWGKGIASSVTKRVVRLAFDRFKLHRISLTASHKNVAGILAYESAGFTHEGKMRDAFFRGGEFSDKVIMGILSYNRRERVCSPS